jgi:para-nitrobenzyl esterase
MHTALAGLVFLLAVQPDGRPAPPAALQGTAWTVVVLQGTVVDAQPEPHAPHLVFGAGGRLSGSDGCNRVTGSYTTKGENGVSFGRVGSTQMACESGDDAVRRFHAALKGTSHFSIVEGKLQLLGATGDPLAVLAPRQMPLTSAGAPALRGTAWRLVRFEGGDDSVRTPDDPSKYTIEFQADGRIAARVDCNRGRSSWKASASGSLELGPLMLSRAMCPPGSLHDVIVKQWPYVRSFVLKDGHLFLALMADGGSFEFEPPPAK